MLVQAAIRLYLQDLDNLLQKYKTYSTSTTAFYAIAKDFTYYVCEIHMCNGPCDNSEMTKRYINPVFF